jgi:hypothetical protein
VSVDYRLPEHRRDTFLDFYGFHLRHRSHPGGVYYALPALADARGWDLEQRAWAAFVQGNTQNPVTTALLMEAGDRPEHADAVLAFWREHYVTLSWDTDRRYHKARFDDAVAGYLSLTKGRQGRYWRAAGRGGWDGLWTAANRFPTMGRLSTWSYLEYLRILGVTAPVDPDTLLLGDRDGSRSHRNGLLLVLGLDEWMWWDNNPGFDGRYPRDLTRLLEQQGEQLLADARRRNPGHPDVGYLTLESALCTYKSWHRPRRRYAGVYNDLLHDRILHAEALHGHRFDDLWQGRRDALPEKLRLEDNPNDPGCVPAKQDWYRTTGEVIVMDLDDPQRYANGFTTAVSEGRFGIREGAR